MSSFKRKQVGVLIGSLRRDSFSRKVTKALSARTPDGVAGEIFRVEYGGSKLVHRHADTVHEDK